VLPVDRPAGDGDGRRERFLMRARLAGAVLIVVHLTTVYWLAVREMSGPWLAAGSATPLRTIRAYLALGPAGAVWHLGGAMLVAAPLGVLFPLVGGRVVVSGAASFARTTFGGMLLAFGAEMIRTGFAGQIFDVDVVLLNTAGVALLHLAVVPAARATLRRRGFGGVAAQGRGGAGPTAGANRATVGATP
jgi:glycopeptide antibiotics resistance protein